MPTIVIVGGQFGSEGKGKLTAYLSQKNRVDVAVRCGGPNAGHSFAINGETRTLRQVPTAVVNPSVRLLIAPGAVIDPAILMQEIRDLRLTPRAATFKRLNRTREEPRV